MINKIKSTILQYVAIGLSVWWLFNLNSFQMIGFVIGVLLISLLCIGGVRYTSTILAGTLLFYLVGVQINFAVAMLLGINVAGFYLYIKKEKNGIIQTIVLLNTIAVANMIFPVAIEKLRGFNKLDGRDVALAIPLVTLIPLALSSIKDILLETIKSLKKYQSQIVLTIASILLVIYFSLSYFKFREIGTDKIYIPLLCGIVSYLINYFLSSKYTAVKILINIILIIIVPYQIVGILGAVATFVVAYTSSTLLKANSLYLNSLLPIILLLGSIEIREDRGLITEFNMGNGSQLGYTLISMIFIMILLSILDKAKKIFEENEIPYLIPLGITLFTTGIFPIIIKFGKYQAISGLAIATSLLILCLQLFSVAGITKSNTEEEQGWNLLAFGLLLSSFSYFSLVLY